MRKLKCDLGGGADTFVRSVQGPDHGTLLYGAVRMCVAFLAGMRMDGTLDFGTVV